MPLSIEEATAELNSWGLKLSPSGRYVLVLQLRNESQRILVADLEQPQSRPFVYPLSGGVIKWADWASNDRLLFCAKFWVGKDRRAIPAEELEEALFAIPVTRVFAIDHDGGNLQMLFSDNWEVLESKNLSRVTNFLPSDPKHIIMPAWYENSLDLFKLDIDDGTSERIALGTRRTLFWFTDADGNPAFRLDTNWLGSRVNILVRKGPAEARGRDLDWDKIASIDPINEQRDAAPEFYPLVPGPEPETFYVAARPDGSDTTGIHLYDVVHQRYVKEVRSEPGFDIVQMFYKPRTHEYVGAAYYADRWVNDLVDPALQAHLNGLNEYFGPEIDIQLIDRATQGNLWLLYTTGPRDPGSYYVYDLDKHRVLEIGHQFPVIDKDRLGSTQVLRYKARDGLEIMGYLTRPPNTNAGDRPPLIMMPHGGPEVRDTLAYDPLVQLLATRGYQVFRPNFRGSSGFGKSFADSGKREWGGAMQDDLTDALRYLVDAGYVDSERACILGASYGGYAALAAATMTPDLYRCAISQAGISDLRDQLKSDRKAMRGNEDEWEYMKRQIGDPSDDKQMLEQRSPINRVQDVHIPILLIHVDEDQRIPLEQSRAMEKALRKAGKDVELLVVEGAGHSPTRKQRQTIYPAILDFVEKHLPATPAAPALAAP